MNTYSFGINGYKLWNTFSEPITSFFTKTKRAASIIGVETYATVRHILPASLVWLWRTYVLTDIRELKLDASLSKAEKTSHVAHLYMHGGQQGKNEHPPILFLHGDYGHPYSLLHLANIAEKKGHRVFSLHIPKSNDNKLFDASDSLLERAIGKICAFTGSKQILGVGHSKGAILLAHRQFVHLDLRIKATCSLAGRLRIPNASSCSDPILSDRIKKIYEKIQENGQFPLMQIVPDKDWNASWDSMAVRQNNMCYTVPGMHLSGMYSNEAKQHFAEFIDV